VPHLPVQPQVVGQPDHAAIDPGTNEALLQQVLEEIAVLALLAADQGGQDHEIGATRQADDPLEDLVAGLGGDRPAALRTMPLAHPGVKHPQIVVNLGDRAYGRAGVLAGRLLRDRDRGADAGDQVDVWLGHLAEELPGEARKALDVAALPLGIEGVEGQRTLPRAAHAGQADQLVPRQ